MILNSAPHLLAEVRGSFWGYAITSPSSSANNPRTRRSLANARRVMSLNTAPIPFLDAVENVAPDALANVGIETVISL